MNRARTIAFANEQLGREIEREVDRIVDRLPRDSSCLLTGSIIEGLGNDHSDIDIYVVHSESVGANSIAVGMRESRYVDCEYMTYGSLAKLEERIAASGPRELLDLPLSALDRYYRVSIAVPAQVAEGGALVLDRFDPAVARRVFTDWCALTAYQLLARGACRFAEGEEREALLLLRAAALWRANGVLSDEGEGYPSLKWTGEKAARKYGRDSARYRELLGDAFAPQGGTAQLLERVRSAACLRAQLAEALGGRTCSLAPEVRHVSASGREVLTKGRVGLAELDGLAAALCRELAVDGDWHRAIHDLSERLGVPEAETSAVAWHETAALRVSGFLRSVVEPAAAVGPRSRNDAEPVK